MTSLEQELGAIKEEPIKHLIQTKGFKELCEIEPMSMQKERLIKSK